MNRFYLVPIEYTLDGHGRGPKYFKWRLDPDLPALVQSSAGFMDYGFVPAMLVASNILQTEHDALILNTDVYAFPENLDQPVTDSEVDVYFEAINIPTDWLTPSTSYRELLRQLAGMFQFNQRYGGIAARETGELHSIFDNADLDTRLRQMPDQEQAWFLATADSFGFDSGLINANSKLRLLVKQAGDYWVGQTFRMGGLEF